MGYCSLKGEEEEEEEEEEEVQRSWVVYLDKTHDPLLFQTENNCGHAKRFTLPVSPTPSTGSTVHRKFQSVQSEISRPWVLLKTQR